jgi:cytidylate kinase
MNNTPQENTKSNTKHIVQKMQAITISRQYGGGGGEIANRLAKRLGWQLLDQEAVLAVAEKLGITVEAAEEQDESVPSFSTRILHNLSMMQPAMSSTVQTIPVGEDEAYHKAIQQVLEAALQSGHVVLVGRASQMLHRERHDILHVRIVAPLEARVAYVKRREGLSDLQARARIKSKDSGRARYLQAHYGEHPDNPYLHDLIINTGILDLDSAVQLIVDALADKAKMLAKSAEELGPHAGLEAYPNVANDFNVLTSAKQTITPSN